MSNTPDADAFEGRMVPGAACADAPVAVAGRPAWLLRQLPAGRFTVLLFDGPDGAASAASADMLRDAAAGLHPLQVLRIVTAARPPLAGVLDLVDEHGLLAKRFDGQPGTLYLLRPDQHVCARWRHATPADIQAALRRALAFP